MLARLFIITALLIAAFGCPTSAVAQFQGHYFFDWARSFGSTGSEEVYDVASDDVGNIFMAGGNGNLLLAKYGPAGAPAWFTSVGGLLEDKPHSIAIDDDGNVIVVGHFNGTVDFGAGPLTSVGAADIFVASYDTDGVHRWSRRFGGLATDVATDVAVGSAGSLAICGTFDGVVDFGGGPVGTANAVNGVLLRLDASGNYVSTGVLLGQDYPEFHWFPEAIALDASDDAYLVGSLSDCDLGCHQYGFVQKFDGVVADWRTLVENKPFTDAAVGVSGDVYVTGRNAFVRLYSSGGSPGWTREWDGNVGVDALCIDPGGDVIVAVHYAGTVDFGAGPTTAVGAYDVMTLALDNATGALHATGTIVGPMNEVCNSIASIGSGEFVLGGYFLSEIEIDGSVLTSVGGQDGMVVKGSGPYPLAVAITEFRARIAEGGVTLDAAFRSDLAVAAVNVYRSDDATEFRPTRIVTASPTGDRFEFVDREVLPVHTYRYQIGVVDADGEFMSEIVTVTTDRIGIALSQNRPNPFNPSTTIRFTLPASEHVTLSIYDTAGRSVRTLVNEMRALGPHEVTWDGRDDHGAGVASGVYHYRLQAGKRVESRKMVLLK